MNQSCSGVGRVSGTRWGTSGRPLASSGSGRSCRSSSISSRVYDLAVATQDDVRRMCIALPDTSEDPSFFRFFRDGRQFVWAWLQRVDAKKARVANREVIAVRTAGELAKQDLLS